MTEAMKKYLFEEMVYHLAVVYGQPLYGRRQSEGWNALTEHEQQILSSNLVLHYLHYPRHNEQAGGTPPTEPVPADEPQDEPEGGQNEQL